MSRTSAAYRSGLRPGDVVLTFNGTKVDSAAQLWRLVADTPIGTSVKLKVRRAERRRGPHRAGRGGQPAPAGEPVTPPLALSFFDGQPEWAEVALVLGLAFVVASLVAWPPDASCAWCSPPIYGDDAHGPRLVATPVLVTRLVTFLLALPVTALPMLDAIGQRYDVGLDQKSVLRWLLGSGLRIAIIVTIAWLIIRIVVSATTPARSEMARGTVPGSTERLKRAKTLGALVKNVAVTLVGGIALLMVLRELNVDVMPMLTGAGIAGVALGFGAQWLVRDLIAGFFLILEDQVRVGDSVVINGQGGGVEAINLRTTILRDVEGAVHVFPNGAIMTLSNRTRDYAYYLIDVNVDFQQDTDKVVEVLRATAASLQEDPTLRPYILEPLEVLGVDAFRDGQVTIRSRHQDAAAPPVGCRPRDAAAPAHRLHAGRHRPAGGWPAHDADTAKALVERSDDRTKRQDDPPVFQAARAEVQNQTTRLA